MEGAMINWARVQELEDDIGTDILNEVVELFLDEVEVVIDYLRLGDVGRNLEEDMHLLKGSALNLGFDALGGLCSSGEKIAAEGRNRDVPVTQILKAYDASKAEFLGRLASN